MNKCDQFAIIYTASGVDPKIHRATIKTDKITYTTVGVPAENKALVIEVAKEMVAQGAKILELCGGFGPIWVAEVTKAIKGAVPVGGVFYGPECRQQLVDLGLAQTLHFD